MYVNLLAILLAIVPPALATAFLAAVSSSLRAQDAIELSTEKRVLDNGLTVILSPDDSTPLVAVRMFYKVGSRNEHTGITGAAHLFEHMMFNGTKRYRPKMFDRVLEQAGGAGNAYTSRDVTCYTTTVPPASLATVLDLEADRMTGLTVLPHILSNELRVVLEERRQMLEDKPVASARVVFLASLFEAHPYRWPVLGWASDVRKMDRKTCLDFYKTYYAPNNAVLSLAGDFEVEPTMDLIESYFGKLSRGPLIPAVRTVEPEHAHSGRMIVKKKTPNPVVLLGFHGPSARDKDAAVVDLIHEIMSRGAAARLYRRLILKEKIATLADLKHDWMIDAEPLYFEVSLFPGGDVERVEELLWEEIELLQEELCSAAELKRAIITRTAWLLRYGLGSPDEQATFLGRSEILVGDHRRVLALPALWAAITPERVREVARRFFVRDRAHVTVLMPEDDE